MLLTGWPAIVDDLGDGKSGTPFNKVSFWDVIKAAIEALVHSTTNPLISPAAMIDEMVLARGSLATIWQRLAVALNDDGTLKTQSSLLSLADARTMIHENLAHDDLLLLWPDGDAAAPRGWVASGTGVAVARCGTGLGDTTKLKYGPWTAKLTYGTTNAALTKQLVTSAMLTNATGIKGRWITLACRAKASVASAMQIKADDGLTVTVGGAAGNNTYHTGDGSDEWIYVQHQMSATATKLDIIISNILAGSVYLGPWMFCLGKVTPADFVPARWGSLYVREGQPGVMAAGASIFPLSKLRIPRDCIYMGVRGALGTVNTGADATWNPTCAGGALYSTPPKVIDAAAPPVVTDGTLDAAHYAYRCFKENDFFWFLCATVGSGVAGADATFVFEFQCPMPKLEILGRF